MSATARVIPIGRKAVRVAFGGIDTLVVNRGSSTCWLATSDGLSGDDDQVAILDPGGTLLFNGESDWWAVTPDGSAGLINSIPGAGAQTFTAKALADAIASEGGAMGGVWLPSDDGLLAATEDPWASVESSGLPNAQHGQLLLSRIMVRTPITTSKGVVLYVPLSSGGQACYFGLYNAAGNQVAASASIATQLAAADVSGLSPVQFSWTAEASPDVGMYWAAELIAASGGGGAPVFWGSGLNAGSALSPAGNPATARTGLVGAPGTYATLPASFNPATIVIPPDGATDTAVPFWLGLLQ